MSVRLERGDPGVVTVVLDNPDKRNALDAEHAGALRRVAADLRGDRSVRCVVVTGAGPAFCSGADLGALRAQPAPGTLGRRELLGEYYRAFLDVADLPMPTIAAVNGPAIGAGLNLALACDLRIAAESARFGATFTRLGIHPGGGVLHALTRLVGPGYAAELVFTAEPVDAGRALEMGLVNRVVPDAELAAAATALAATIAATAPAATRAAKRTLRIALDADRRAVLEIEALAQAATQESDDAAEGWAAMRERRMPRFPDR